MSAETEPLIVKVIRAIYPDWKPPKDTGREWYSCLCPFHGDSRPSATISYQNNAFSCFSCGEKGDAIGIIMREEGLSYRKAVEYAEAVSPGSHDRLSREPRRKSGRRTFGRSRTPEKRPDETRDREVSSRVRRRTTPWT